MMLGTTLADSPGGRGLERTRGEDVLSLLVWLRVIDGMHKGEVQAEAYGDDGKGAANYERKVVEGEGPNKQPLSARLN